MNPRKKEVEFGEDLEGKVVKLGIERLDLAKNEYSRNCNVNQNSYVIGLFMNKCTYV